MVICLPGLIIKEIIRKNFMNQFKFFIGASILTFLTLFYSNQSLAMNDEDHENNKKIPSKESTSKKSKKPTNPISKKDSVENLTDLLEVMSTNDTPKIEKKSPSKQRLPEDNFNALISSPSSLNHIAQVVPSVPLTLARFDEGESLTCYTQKLIFGNHVLELNRLSTRTNIEYVRVTSLTDRNKTHLLAQGVCKTKANAYQNPFKTSIGFPNIVHNSNLPIDWVSFSSQSATNQNCYVRRPDQGVNGGHSEPQFIGDFNAKFVQNSDSLVNLFMPETTDNSDIYMCGLELFGPYDMCDRYDCVGKLKTFRGEHQEGQTSISQAIRDRLQNRFKGSTEDAFVVIYHAKYSYKPIGTYYAANDNNEKSPLTFGGIFGDKAHQFNVSDTYNNKNHFFIDNTYALSQYTELDTAPDDLYAYIHHICDKSVKYNGSFTF